MNLSALYAANTWGAALGALVAGFLLIRLLGLRGTVYVAAVINAAVAVAAWLLARRSAATARQGAAAEPRRESAAARGTTDVPARRHAPKEPARGGSGGVYSQRRPRYGEAAPPRPATLLITFGAAGATTLAYEVLWSRVLHALLGNSTYAFTTTLVVFLGGIALGGLVGAPCHRPRCSGPALRRASRPGLPPPRC